MVSLSCIFESHLQDALHLRARIDVGVISLVVVLVFLSEIHTSGEFADTYEVGSLHQFRSQRTFVQETFEGLHRTDVGKQPEFFSHGEESLFRSHFRGGVVVEPKVPHGCEEDGIGILASLEGLFGEGVTHLVDGLGPADGLSVGHLMPEFLSDGIHDSHTLYHDLWSYTVAREDGYFKFHISEVFCGYRKI